jgi:hypothetical protein
VATPSTVIPAQAEIHMRDVFSRNEGPRYASYGSRAPLHGPGMTGQPFPFPLRVGSRTTDLRLMRLFSSRPETGGEEGIGRAVG